MADKKEEIVAEKPDVVASQQDELGATSVSQPKDDIKTEAAMPDQAAQKAPKKSFKEWVKSKQGKVALAAIAGVILLVGVLFAVPITRYAIAGTFIRKDLVASVVDSKSGKPISDAEISVANTSAKTDKDGKATLGQVPVGQYQLNVKKKHFKDLSTSVTVPILSAADAGQVKLEATGRQVPITVVNKIGGQAVSKVTITADDTTTITDDKGEAILVLPANATTTKATLKADGYNEQQVAVTVTEQRDDKNAFSVTPSGKLYFLSKRTGKINVMKSNLDGSDPQTVLQGTGKEYEGETILLASRDWKYLALKARRDSDQAKLYLINTANDQLSLIDEGNAEFSLSGWNNHSFIYTVNRLATQEHQPKKYALKSFDADANKLATLDETGAEGSVISYRYEWLTQVYILDQENRIVYTKNWNSYNAPSTRQNTVSSVQANGSNKKVLKAFELGAYVSDGLLYKPNEIYYRTFQGSGNRYYEYEGGAIKDSSTIKASDFGQFYPTWLLSPSGEKTFWYEPRDGKNTLFLGDKLGEDGKEIATLSELRPYGWYGDGNLLMSKAGSELYIMSANETDAAKALKITDYHKPSVNFYGYGGGYGGF
jgi:hypothetical protein